MKSFLGFTYFGDEKSDDKGPKFIKGGWGILVVVVLVALGIMWYAERGFYRDSGFQTSPIRSKPPTGYARIEVDFGNGSRRLFEGEVDGTSYPLHAVLGSAAEEGGFTVTFSDGSVQEIAGVGNGAGKWLVYRNGRKLGRASVDQIMIGDGDHYTLRYE